MYEDPEIVAMSKVLEALKNLNNSERRRIVEWASSKFGIVEVIQPGTEKPTIIAVEESPEKETSQISQIETPTQDETVGEQEEDNGAAISQKGLGLKRYKTVEALFLSADVKTINSKILLVAAYLQEKMGYKEFSGFDINSRLKKMGYGVSNISASMNGLITKKSPLIVQTGKDGDSKQGKRKFRVTDEGLKIARSYLRGKGKGEF